MRLFLKKREIQTVEGGFLNLYNKWEIPKFGYFPIEILPYGKSR